MNIKKYGISVLLLVSLSLGLVACSGVDKETYIPLFSSTWELQSIDSADSAVTPEDIMYLKENGYTCTLTLTEDGVATLDYFGDSEQGNWDASSETQAAAVFRGASLPIDLQDGSLSLGDNAGSKLVFTKAASLDSSNTASSDEAPDASASLADDSK